MGQQTAHCINPAGIDQALHQRGRHQATRRIVHQHPIQVSRTTRLQLGQAIGDGLSAGSSTTCGNTPAADRGPRRKEIVTRGHHDKDSRNIVDTVECRQGVQDQRLACHRLVLLGL
jgi:hypothetical protein